jgi:methionyl-tRNA synthetase
MEKRLNTKLDNYVTAFKREVVDKIRQGLVDEDLIHFVMEYKGISLEDKDFLKRKRSNNVVPICEKCTAKRMNGTQCTRRKQGGTEFCGTHIKGTPHGVIEPSATSTGTKQVEIFLQEINGIVYYIDTENRVYSMEDVMSNKSNPKIIASYRVVDGVYCIV